MSRTLLLLIFVLSMGIVTTASASNIEIISEAPLLWDGFVFNGFDGNLIGPHGNDVWFFELTSDVNDYKTVIKAGTKLELLPSSALEKMIAGKKTRNTMVYRLWNSRVTRYKGKNFIFPGYFMPLNRAEKPKVSPESQGQPAMAKPSCGEPNQVPSKQPREHQLKLEEPNDILSIPQEIVEKLKAGREKTAVGRRPTPDSNEISFGKPQSATKEKLPEVESYSRSTDSVYVDRTGFLIEQHDKQLVFVPDALGMNVQKLSFHLLPCAMLELTELKQAAEPDKVRFKVAGIITKYKGKDYLLLEKATRAYSYGNFGR
jgi:hypothetical protein